ncbi:MAG TPA: NAD(P)-binding domain-containing protein [Bacteroidota bacterium]|nr:NAD(P)-binding domain-containing protein [Bacteroidota bacterium]
MATREIQTKRTIAVLGAASRIGWGLALSLARGGYRVLLSDDGSHDGKSSAGKLSSLVDRIRPTAARTNLDIVSTSHEASWEADIIILAVPFEVQDEIAGRIKDVAAGKTVVSVANPLNDHCDGLLTSPTTSAAEELAHRLPQSRIVKAFNTIFPAQLEKPAASGRIVDVFVAGDDDDAVSTVMQLVRDAGFHPIYAGRLAMSGTLERMMVLLISIAAHDHPPGTAGWMVVHDTDAPGTDQTRHNESRTGHAMRSPATPRQERRDRKGRNINSHTDTRADHGRHE